MKKYKIKLIDKIGGFKIFEVDGGSIRKNLDKNFTNFGQSFRFPFIEKNEFWIDKGYKKEELPFFITHLFVEHRLMKKGVGYSKALERADTAERASRYKSKIFKNAPKDKKGEVKEVIKKLLFKVGDIKVYEVDGEKVRTLLFDDFAMGGNSQAYPNFMDSKQVWIDDTEDPEEFLYTLAHEIIEYRLMTRGKSYEQAHRSALNVEFLMRGEEDEDK